MRRTSGQSMVEMALLLPLMIILIFGIIDMGWYVYGYATIFQSVRNGAEVAAQLPPFESAIAARSKSDPCYKTIIVEIEEDAAMFPDIADNVQVSYPSSSSGASAGRALGNLIQVQVTYDLKPLTPLFQFVPLTPDGKFHIVAKTVRSIENLGNTLITEDYPRGIACKE